jgi:hypothetical protein
MTRNTPNLRSRLVSGLVAISAGLMSLAPAVAVAAEVADATVQEGDWTVSLASRNRVVRDAAFDLFSSDDVLPGIDLTLTRRVWDELSLGVSWQAGGASEASVLGRYNFDFSYQTAAVTVLYESLGASRAMVGGDWLRPTLRAEGGVVFGRAGVTLDNPAGDVAAELIQWKVAPRLHTAVGLRYVPFSNTKAPTTADGEEGHAYTFAVDFEIGWTLLTRMDFDALEPDPGAESVGSQGASVDDDEPAIVRHPLDLGELVLEGGEFRIGVLMFF